MNLKIQILISLFLLLSQAGVMAQDDFIDEDNCFITQTQPAKV